MTDQEKVDALCEQYPVISHLLIHPGWIDQTGFFMRRIYTQCNNVGSVRIANEFCLLGPGAYAVTVELDSDESVNADLKLLLTMTSQTCQVCGAPGEKYTQSAPCRLDDEFYCFCDEHASDGLQIA